jgi:hypothetical protein
MTWEIDADVWIERDEYGFARHVRHIQAPFSSTTAKTAYDLAIEYLDKLRDELGVTLDQLSHLKASIPDIGSGHQKGAMLAKPGEQLRWWRRREMRKGADETTVLIIQQTHDVPLRTWHFRLNRKVTGTAQRDLPPFPFPLPMPIEETTAFLNVYGAGLRIVVHRQDGGTLAVTSATSTLRHNFNFAHAAALAASTKHLTIYLPEGTEEEAKTSDKNGGNSKPANDSRGPWIAHMTDKVLEQILAGLGEDPSVRPVEPDFWIYRYDPQEAGDGASSAEDIVGSWPRRRDSTELVPNSDYPVSIIRHIPQNLTGEFRVGLDTPPLDIVSRVPDFTVLTAIPLIAGAEAPGMVFLTDPMSAGHPLGPNKPSRALNRARSRVTLPRLKRASGTPRRLRLRGDNVTVVDWNEVEIGSIGIDPPREAPGTAFNYDARTNHFAAVNAYYHLDGMFQRLNDFGLPFADYAPTFSKTSEVIHRAAIRPGPGGDGRCINAQIRIRPGKITTDGNEAEHTLQFRFALADLSLRPGTPGIYLDEDNKPQLRPQNAGFPLGIACDVRWVWHEFGHALIAGGTGNLELPFAHSVGDALAAINCDPGSALAQSRARGVTFPWVALPLRRHDREAADGWSWSGRLGSTRGYRDDVGDMAGYRREQVLSSTLFKLYRAAGGDATLDSGKPNVGRRQRTADYVTYLIARAIGSLGPAATTPASDASVFASSLMDADRGTRTFKYAGHPPKAVSQVRIGGALHKVIRWSFEKQGLYARNTLAEHGEGDPEPIDIYVDDGRNGEYLPLAPPNSASEDLWARNYPDGRHDHQPPRLNRTSYIYVKVRNRGYQTAFGAHATMRVARSRNNLGWPSAAWTDLPPQVPEAADGDIAANDHIVLGPFAWRPTARGRYKILVEVDAPGDRSNINPATGLPCASPAASPTLLSELVPFDNNLATAEWQV